MACFISSVGLGDEKYMLSIRGRAGLRSA